MNLDIVRIDVKNAKDFFDGFYQESAVMQYTYRLCRMLDFRQVVNGDYLLVKADGKPFVALQINRTNSRRFWENSLRIATVIDHEFISRNIYEVIKLLAEYLLENRESIFSPLPLLYVVDQKAQYAQQLKSVLDSLSYQKLNTIYELAINTNEHYSHTYSDIKLKPFTSLSVDERLSIVKLNDINYLPGIKIDYLYQDYLESGEISEILWQLLILDDTIIGYAMVCQKDFATKPVSELFNYWLSDDLSGEQKLSAISLIINYIFDSCKNTNIQKALISVRENDLNVWQQLLDNIMEQTKKEIYIES